MQKKLSTFFNKAASFLKKPFLATAAAFAMAFTPAVLADSDAYEISTAISPASPAPVATPSHNYTYWRYSEYDIVAKTWECNENKLCAAIHSADPNDPDNKMLLAKMKGYATRENRSLGRGQFVSYWKPAPHLVSDWEIRSYEGFQPDINVAKTHEGRWKGTITSPFNYKTYGLDVEKKDEDSLKLSGYFTEMSFFKLSITAERIPDPTLPPPTALKPKHSKSA